MTLFRIITAAALPVLFAILFDLLEKRTKWQSKSYAFKQAIIGICFGALAVLATEFGIPVDGAVLNVRNAAPVAAGLLFGWPAGLIAGFIGGVERWFATLWGVGEFTRLACTLGTILAGVIGAASRVWLLDDRKPGWFHGLAVGVTAEVLHMLMVFLTNTDDIQRAFLVVQQCADQLGEPQKSIRKREIRKNHPDVSALAVDLRHGRLCCHDAFHRPLSDPLGHRFR